MTQTTQKSKQKSADGLRPGHLRETATAPLCLTAKRQKSLQIQK
jgi:hypothetical protein